MNAFLTIMCFALIATATTNPAYNYQPPQATVDLAPQYAATLTPQYLEPIEQQHAAPAPVVSVSQNQPSYPPQPQTIIAKDIFIHSAPEETEEISHDLGAEGVGPNRRNYRVLFIRAPAQNLKLNLNSLKLAQAANEDKTVIYVLARKPDLGIIQSQLVALQPEHKIHRPEVHFIKYKTQEEANRAQQEIQAQYEALGGSTQITNGGFSPVSSFIGGGHVNVGSVGPSLTSGNSGSLGSAFAADNSGSFSSVVGPGNSFAGQQSFQSNPVSTYSSASLVAAPSQNYLPAQGKLIALSLI